MKGAHATTLGAASGAVAGLVAITPCAGFVGGLVLLGEQAVAATLAWSGAVSFVLAKVIAVTVGLRADADEEARGLDITQHAETAYSFGDFGSMARIG